MPNKIIEGLDALWIVAPAQESWDVWNQCREQWLAAKGRRSGKGNTAQAYASDWRQFMASSGVAPWQVGRSHVEQWVAELSGRGLAAATIQRKVSALASFYDYAAHDYTLQDPQRGEIGLWERPNPFRTRDLARPRSRAIYPSLGEVQAMLQQIDLGTVVGLRNYAIVYGLFTTTRRIAEWIGLRWGDIHEGSNGGHWFEYRYKGGAVKQQTMPEDTYATIRTYLVAAGREDPDPGDYVFVGHGVGARTDQHVSASCIWRALRRYGRLAGITDLRKCRPHGLRHAGARARKDLGASIWELQETLGHASIAVTERYSRATLAEPQDPYAARIGQLLPRRESLFGRSTQGNPAAGPGQARGGKRAGNGHSAR